MLGLKRQYRLENLKIIVMLNTCILMILILEKNLMNGMMLQKKIVPNDIFLLSKFKMFGIEKKLRNLLQRKLHLKVVNNEVMLHNHFNFSLNINLFFI